MSFYHKLNKERSYHRGFFLAATLAITGICSMFPMMCFKHYSSKERAKMKQKVEKLQDKKDEVEEEMARIAHPNRSRHHSHSPRRSAHAPHRHHRRRHSSAMPRDTHDFRGRRFRPEDLEDLETSPVRKPRQHRQTSRPRHQYDQQLDRERRKQWHGHSPPPRRYHHSS